MTLAEPRAYSIVPNDLEAFWMPFTANRAFKKRRACSSRAKDMHYYTPDGRDILDGTAGMWCCNAGHNRDPIVAAIKAQAAELDYAPRFQFAHPKSFQLACAHRRSSRRAISTMCSSATRARKPSTPRSRSPSPTTA